MLANPGMIFQPGGNRSSRTSIWDHLKRVSTALGAILSGPDHWELPARIFLFQRNLERHAAHSELAEEITVTLYHELGHYLGLDEAEVEDMGLA